MTKIPKKTLSAPTSTTLRSLYVLSGNLCANPKCNTVLINNTGTMVAEVCHIRAKKSGGKRYDSKMTDTERHDAKNLILLCNVCHKLVDTEDKKYTVPVLTKWKNDREAKFSAVGDTLRLRYLAQVSDEAEAVDPVHPKSLDAFRAFLEHENCSHSLDEGTPTAVADYADRLRHLTLPDRDLLRAIIERIILLGGNNRVNSYGLQVHPDDLKTLHVEDRRLTDGKIKKLGDTLSRHDLGGIDVDEEPRLFISSPDSEVGWGEVKDFLEGRGMTLRDVVCDLKFGLLD